MDELDLMLEKGLLAPWEEPPNDLRLRIMEAITPDEEGGKPSESLLAEDLTWWQFAGRGMGVAFVLSLVVLASLLAFLVFRWGWEELPLYLWLWGQQWLLGLEQQLGACWSWLLGKWSWIAWLWLGVKGVTETLALDREVQAVLSGIGAMVVGLTAALGWLFYTLEDSVPSSGMK